MVLSHPSSVRTKDPIQKLNLPRAAEHQITPGDLRGPGTCLLLLWGVPTLERPVTTHKPQSRHHRSRAQTLHSRGVSLAGSQERLPANMGMLNSRNQHPVCAGCLAATERGATAKPPLGLLIWSTLHARRCARCTLPVVNRFRRASTL